MSAIRVWLPRLAGTFHKALEDVVQDLRYGMRTLRRAPVFSVLTIATLTLAIGAHTAIFSLVDPLLFRDLPVRDPGSLVQFTWQYPGDPSLNMFTAEDSERYRVGNTVFSDIIGLVPLRTAPVAGGEAIGADVVTGNFFSVLGVQPTGPRVGCLRRYSGWPSGRGCELARGGA